MKAIVQTKYGNPDILKLIDMEKPIPQDNEILVKIHAGTVTSGDVRIRGADFPLILWLPVRLMLGIRRPKKFIPGHELSGEVEAVGKDVTKFNIGDQIFGTTTMLKYGSNAEYICLPETWKSGVVALKPTNMSYEEAAAIPIGGMTAHYLLKKANIQSGNNVLVYGASGSVGTYAVQLAKAYGANVTGVCSTANIEMVKSIGADHVIDYTKEDFSIMNQKYDIIFEAVGKVSKSYCKKVLQNNGTYVSIKMLTKEQTGSLLEIKELVEAGKIKPIIDRKFPLELVPEAHVYVDKGHKKGNVVITISD